MNKRNEDLNSPETIKEEEQSLVTNSSELEEMVPSLKHLKPKTRTMDITFQNLGLRSKKTLLKNYFNF